MSECKHGRPLYDFCEKCTILPEPQTKKSKAEVSFDGPEAWDVLSELVELGAPCATWAIERDGTTLRLWYDTPSLRFCTYTSMYLDNGERMSYSTAMSLCVGMMREEWRKRFGK
jgi:hypothetical protein